MTRLDHHLRLLDRNVVHAIAGDHEAGAGKRVLCCITAVIGYLRPVIRAAGVDPIIAL